MSKSKKNLLETPVNPPVTSASIVSVIYDTVTPAVPDMDKEDVSAQETDSTNPVIQDADLLDALKEAESTFPDPELVNEYFEQYPNAAFFYVTEDHMFFLPKDKSYADGHRQKVGGELIKVERAASEE